MVVKADGSGCMTTNCTLAYCDECYSSGGSCYRCQTGYEVSSNGSCVVAACSIGNCNLCNGALCSSCLSGYELSGNEMSCNPVCSDIYCTSCVGVEVCGTCEVPYSPDSSGKCVINCSLIGIANCQECSSDT